MRNFFQVNHITVNLANQAFAGQDSRDIKEADDHDQANKDRKADHVNQTFSVWRDSPASASPLDQYKHQASAIEGGNGQNVNQSQADADNGDQLEEWEDTNFGNFARDLSDTNGTSETRVGTANSPTMETVLCQQQNVHDPTEPVLDGIQDRLPLLDEADIGRTDHHSDRALRHCVSRLETGVVPSCFSEADLS